MTTERARILLKRSVLQRSKNNASNCFWLTILPREFPKSQKRDRDKVSLMVGSWAIAVRRAGRAKRNPPKWALHRSGLRLPVLKYCIPLVEFYDYSNIYQYSRWSSRRIVSASTSAGCAYCSYSRSPPLFFRHARCCKQRPWNLKPLCRRTKSRSGGCSWLSGDSLKRGDLYGVPHPSARDPRRSRVFVVVSRQVLIDSKFSTVICAPIYSAYHGLSTQVLVGIGRN